MTSRATFSVVVPIRDERGTIERTIPSLEEAVDHYGQAELIVVDNGSSDGSYEWLKKNLGDNAALLRSPEGNIGAVRNHGAREASGEYVCFIDADCIVDRNYFEAADEALQESSAAMVGSRYALPEQAGWLATTWHSLHCTEKNGYVSLLSGGNMVIDLEVFEGIGGFRKDLITGEDAELCQRLLDSGHRIYQDLDVRAVHLGYSKSLGGFFQKQRWYALGMFGTVGGRSVDKPVAATLVHFLILLGAALAALAYRWEMSMALGAVAGSAVLVPAASVVYRWWERRFIIRPVRSLILYELFFAARIAAFFLLLIRNRSDWRPAKDRKRGTNRT